MIPRTGLAHAIIAAALLFGAAAALQSAPPAGETLSSARIELGRRLFYDADLSIDGTMSCATCHEQKRGFADGNRNHPGVHGDAARRNVPGLANVVSISPLTWADPRLTTLELQAEVPILGIAPVEMGMRGQEPEIARRLGRDACYRRMFSKAFPETGGQIDLAAVARALAAFERTLTSYDSPYDRHRRGEATLPDAAERGLILFKAECGACHGGANLTDSGFHRIADRIDPGDEGLSEKSGKDADRGSFRTASLRNIALAPPYLHDGSAPTLAEAIRRHDRLPAITALSPAQVDDLVALIAALTDQSFITDPRFAMPGKACGKRL